MLIAIPRPSAPGSSYQAARQETRRVEAVLRSIPSDSARAKAYRAALVSKHGKPVYPEYAPFFEV